MLPKGMQCGCGLPIASWMLEMDQVLIDDHVGSSPFYATLWSHDCMCGQTNWVRTLSLGKRPVVAYSPRPKAFTTL